MAGLFRLAMATGVEPLDELVRTHDPDRWLSSRFIGDPAARADVIALYGFDHELSRAPKVTTNALIGEIRLTWWREVLDEVFEGRPVRRHPTAQALAAAISRHRLARDRLEAMIDARYRELDPAPLSEADAVAWAAGTAGQVAELAVGILDPGASTDSAGVAGAAWALGRRAAADPALKPAFERTLQEARSALRGLSAVAFPAVAHLALVARPLKSEFARRLRLTAAVAQGRV